MRLTLRCSVGRIDQRPELADDEALVADCCHVVIAASDALSGAK